MKKTNALRILDSFKIEYECLEYIFKENEIDALSVAEKIGQEPGLVFKTLVAVSAGKEYFVFVIPGNSELDLKQAAKLTNSKKIDLIPVKELTALTGYIRGGCSPIGMKKQFPTYIDKSAELHKEIFISAGIRGMQIKVPVEGLLRVTNARLVELTI